MQLTPLPGGLGDRFRVGDAIDAGASAGRLRRADLAVPFRGVRVRVESPLPAAFDGRGVIDSEHAAKALAFAPLLTGPAFYSHVTAAVLLGLPLPPAVVAHSPVHVSVLAPHRLPRAAGVRGHQAMPHLTNVCLDNATKLPTTDAATTWAMLAAILKDVGDVVAVGDAAVRDWRVETPLATIGELTATVEAGRRIGIDRLRLALPSIRSRSASRPETLTRLLLVGAGYPEPELNYDVYEFGERLACVDLAYPLLRIAVEYEGDHHRLDADQWASDIARYEQLAAAGWRVIRVTRTDLFWERRRLLRRVEAAFAGRR